MKHGKSILAVLALIALLGVSCKKSSPKPTPIGISLVVNGVAMSSTDVHASMQAGILSVVATVPYALSFVIKNAKVGTFDVVKDDASLLYFRGDYYGPGFTGTTGDLVITSISSTSGGTVDGTFEFSGTDTSPNQSGAYSITNGKFHSGLIILP